MRSISLMSSTSVSRATTPSIVALVMVGVPPGEQHVMCALRVVDVGFDQLFGVEQTVDVLQLQQQFGFSHGTFLFSSWRGMRRADTRRTHPWRTRWPARLRDATGCGR